MRIELEPDHEFDTEDLEFIKRIMQLMSAKGIESRLVIGGLNG